MSSPYARAFQSPTHPHAHTISRYMYRIQRLKSSSTNQIRQNHGGSLLFRIVANHPHHPHVASKVSSSLASSSQDEYPQNQREEETISSSSLVVALSGLFTKYAPLWTVGAAWVGLSSKSSLGSTTGSMTLGSLSTMQWALGTLMWSMGLTITSNDLSRTLFRSDGQTPSILMANALLCFGMMPLLALTISHAFGFTPHQTAGIVLLGSVSGGQASNLFTLLAGGDVALSIVCTLTTTLLGVLATPILIQWLLNCVVVVNGMAVLKSVASLVLIPLVFGLSLDKLAPRLVGRIRPLAPMLGIVSTWILVAGGAANSADLLGLASCANVVPTSMKERVTLLVASCLFPLLGGALALGASHLPLLPRSKHISEASRRTLVIETLSKSPTLAYVLAQTHFGPLAASIPAAGMVSLAVIGALLSSIWSIVSPIHEIPTASK
uniref:Uncharacterized protein n=1 Tax=Attheya septentrionalis TaxID=420275 RepID=A0A7S2UQA2_9STRA